MSNQTNQPPAAGEAAHKMHVVIGTPGVTAKVVYAYRGHAIVRTYRSYDGRNKTHNGYWWEAQLQDGTVRKVGTRAAAKAYVDGYEARAALAKATRTP